MLLAVLLRSAELVEIRFIIVDELKCVPRLEA
jgi:hypothetical protein